MNRIPVVNDEQRAGYLPKDFKGAMIDLAGEVDQLKLDIQKLKEEGIINE